MFNTIPTVDFSAFGTPVQKLIELNTATFTKALEAQQAAVEKQTAQVQADFKAFTEIKDVEGLTSFVTAKTEDAKANFEALKSEAETLAQNTQAYFAEVQAILTESLTPVAPAAKASAKKAA
ncbi:hypothetical protein [Marinobacter sp. X15-166B]|uniref:hypothetical protein n=1 Tax=Marinobacter sp. X15-166B TaxID=1897620 RepID=UPI00085C3F91|nr:hypothetical protein [Marinobacter sp. X15-166B]OEY65096.1 hypothetical protein BG841_00495 [Marinobacter sp. X15-166B]